MQIQAVTHADFEPVGAIADWASDRGFFLNTVTPYRGESLPSLDETDLLVIMGGPQRACELAKAPFLEDEVSLIRWALQADTPVLGICLGAQLMGVASGADAHQSPEPEYGVFPVELTVEGENDPVFSALPSQFEAFHWHVDMPGLPSGAVCLAESAGCPRQAVRFAPRAYGIQFHLEQRQQEVTQLISHCRLPPGQYSQSANVMLAQDFRMLNRTMETFLDRLITA